MKIPPTGALIALILTASACADVGTSSLDGLDPSLKGNAALGLEAFRTECASCHSTGDGFDLAFFGFPDTTIVRRALGHVDMPTSLDIVAHVRSLRAPESDRNANVFQPEGRVLMSDQAFAFELFGVDRWPATLTSADLLDMDPRKIPVAIALPKWSVEDSNVDWMPDVGMSTDVLTFMDGDLALDAYRSVPNEANLLQAILRLRVGAAHPDNPTAPCVFFQEGRQVEYVRCFQNQRWIASLGAQHMLRRNDDYLDALAHDAFWAVGFTAREAVVRGDVLFENGLENWASWMWTGWIFEPGNHSSFYSAQGAAEMGLSRHATFLTLRSQVARPTGSFQPYHDVANAARFSPEPWTASAVAFGLRHLVERLEAGEVPTRFPQDTGMSELRDNVSLAYLIAVRRDPSSAQQLAELRDRVLELMPNG
jgi:hypothetical protein